MNEKKSVNRTLNNMSSHQCVIAFPFLMSIIQVKRGPYWPLHVINERISQYVCLMRVNTIIYLQTLQLNLCKQTWKRFIFYVHCSRYRCRQLVENPYKCTIYVKCQPIDMHWNPLTGDINFRF